ncbi:hypothetical protein HYT23_04955 [Candidatus Pacearchaeota archaeon]|nr:hypothetical protein [Candidatus Pacearchaeota archaeon]
MNLKQELKKFRREGNLNLSSGGNSQIYFDLKEAFGNPEILNCAANNLYGLVDKKPDFVAARGLGGITLATAISLNHKINLTIVRDKHKEHGTRKIIEGYIPKKGDLGIIVDDVFTTGQSIIESVHEVWRVGANICGGYVVIKRNPLEIGIPVKYLFTLDELL